MAMDDMNEVRDFDEDIKDRKALIEEAKQLDLSKNWSEIASAVMNLKKRWKRISYWESAYEDELADEFEKMIDAFYAKRNEGFQSIQKAKEELIERAQVLAKSENWNQATEEMNELLAPQEKRLTISCGSRSTKRATRSLTANVRIGKNGKQNP